ncbi:uncharacterized protein LOC128234178 isoform X9 [Mya arenaria]|uniref:uncharacterized protein LOC128234178 isoform X9 n=1 Tax=Mya arenaria TaxID=6604 RepID=UPI0022E8532B|nr:uncharacterized protein LOC128234178 isoform X9 [Mya arenaria]
MGLYMIFIWIFLNGVCRHVIEAQAPVLSANASSVTKGHPLKLVCTLSAETLSVTWLKTDTGTTTEHTIVTVGLSGGSCASVPSTPPDGLVVTCGSTLDYGCTIPSLNISDDGDVWRCSVPIKGVTTYSNSLRINVTEPAPTPTEPAPTPTEPAPTPTEPAPTPTVTVPSVTGEKHLAVAVTLLVVQICVVLGVFVVLHWIRTRPRGMNFVLWRPWVVIHVGGVIDLVVVCVCGGYHVNINTGDGDGVLMTTGVIVAIILTLILVVAFVFLVTRATKCCGFYNTKKETSPLLERKEVHQQLL